MIGYYVFRSGKVTMPISYKIKIVMPIFHYLNSLKKDLQKRSTHAFYDWQSVLYSTFCKDKNITLLGNNLLWLLGQKIMSVLKYNCSHPTIRYMPIIVVWCIIQNRLHISNNAYLTCTYCSQQFHLHYCIELMTTLSIPF